MVDEVAADEKYKGEVLKVSGKINSIGENVVGITFMTLSGGGVGSPVYV